MEEYKKAMADGNLDLEEYSQALAKEIDKTEDESYIEALLEAYRKLFR